MTSQHRREFLSRAGVLVGVGGALASGGSIGVGPAAASDHDGSDGLRGPYADEDWVGYRGGPGNVAAVDEGPGIEGEPYCEPLAESTNVFDEEAAFVEDTMYVTADGRIRAIDATDGSIEWTSDDVGMSGTPSAAYGKLFGTGGDRVTALDLEDRSVAWSVAYDDRATTPAVAYGLAFAVVDGSVTALDVDDGSTVWERPADENGDDFRHTALAAGAGNVYAIDGSGGLVALDAATGDRLWRDRELSYQWGLAATDERVTASSGRASEEYRVFDAETGDVVGGGSGWRPPAIDDEAVVNVTQWDVRVDFFDDREGWRSEAFSTMGLGAPAMDGDTVYVYLGDEGGTEDSFSVLAYDKYTGERKWTCRVDDSVDEGGPVAVTSDAAYAFGSEEIHAVRDEEPADGAEDSDDADSVDGEDPTDDDDGSADASADSDASTDDEGRDAATGDDEPSDDDSATPTEGSSADRTTGPAETETESSAAIDTVDDGSTAAESTSTEGGDGSVEEGVPVREATDTETVDEGPGFGVASAITGIGGLGYLLRRRLGGGETDGGRET